VADWPGPVFFRLCRNEVPVLFDDNYGPTIGQAITLRPGNDVTLICCGVMVSRTLAAADKLADDGLDARVLEMHTIKPLDVEAVVQAAQETGALVTVEEHSIIGGLGGAVAEAVTDGHPVPLKRVGIDDRFAETGPYDAILDRYGMSIDDITSAAEQAVAAKR
jgi:transketolase